MTKNLERLIVLSDGLFPIAVTWQVTEIKPEKGHGASMWQD